MQGKEKAKNCVIQNGMLKEKAAGDRHRFHIPLILDEKPFQDRRYFFAPLAQLAQSPKDAGILDF